MIERAGGFTEQAYLRGAVFTRESVRRVQQERIGQISERLEREISRLGSQEIQGSLSAEDLASQIQFLAAQEALVARLKNVRSSGRVVITLLPLSMFRGSTFDITLENGDSLFVPEKMSTVNVLGAVFNPGALVFDENRPALKYYLAKTGGVTQNAEKNQMYVIRVDGTVISKQGGSWFGISWDDDENRFGFGRSFSKRKLAPGDTIIVPERIVYPNHMRDVKDITQILYQIAVTAGATVLLF